MDARKLGKRLKNTRIGQLVGIGWLEEFGSLAKSERDILLCLARHKANYRGSAISNKEISEILGVPLKKVYERTKSLYDKNFLEVEEMQLKKDTKPVKHYYLPGTMTRYIPDPASIKVVSKETRPKSEQQQLEPTVLEDTYTKIDPDRKVGYV